MPVLLLFCFFLSGVSSLVLEVVWVRLFAHVFGSTTLAISTVLAAFMGGLALGSLRGGKWVDRGKISPLLAYASCELGIAVWAALVPMMLAAFVPINAWLWQHLASAPLFLAVLRFFLCALVLVPPTALMGATLPFLARHVTGERDALGIVGRRVGLLYAANTAGAVVGVAGAGFWLLALLGVSHTNRVAVSVDVGLAGLVVFMWWRQKRNPPSEDAIAWQTALPELEVAEPPSAKNRRTALLAFAFSGCVAMILEVLWSRGLSLVIGSSTYSFTLVLAVFLVGLAGGAAFMSRRASRARDPHAVLVWVFLALAASITLMQWIMDDLPTVFLAFLENSTLEVGTVFSLQILITALCVIPTALMLGAVMPLCIRLYAGSVSAVGKDVGRVYAANTLGAIIGSFAGGFLVLPLIGLEWGLRLCACAELLFAGWLMVSGLAAAARKALIALPVIAGMLLFAPRWDINVLAAGVFRISIAKRFVEAGHVPHPDVLYHQDGLTTTVTVEKYGDRLALKNNAKVEASSSADMPTQIFVGLLPVLLHGKGEQEVVVIGYGSGVTVGAIAEAPQVKRIDVIEIEPRVYEAADKFFSPYNHEPHNNKRVHRFVGDGRNFLLARKKKYDVIVSEPSNPWIAGVSSLFSREFYAFGKKHLALGGVYCQWAQMYELGPRNVKTIYRTFSEAFQYTYAFAAADQSADTILIGSDHPLNLDLDALEESFANAQLKAELVRGGVRSASDLIAMLIMAPDEIASFSAGADIHTDDNLRLELLAPRDLMAAGREHRFADQIYSDGWPYGHLDSLVTGIHSSARATKLARALISHGKRREAGTWLALGKKMATSDEERASIEDVASLMDLVRMRDFADPEIAISTGGDPLSEPTPDWFTADASIKKRKAAVLNLNKARLALSQRRFEDAHTYLKSLPLPANSPQGRDLKLMFGYTLYKTVRLSEAQTILGPLAKDKRFAKRRPAVLYYLGRVVYGVGRFEEGTDVLEGYLKLTTANAREPL